MTMNLLQMQDALKDMSDAQVSQQLKGPAGQVPQFLLLAELSRRKRTRSDAERQQAGQQAPDQTVKDEAVNAAGMPQGPLPEIARGMAPKTSVAQNTGIARMASGGQVRRMARGDVVKAGEYTYVDNGDGTFSMTDGPSYVGGLGSTLTTPLTPSVTGSAQGTAGLSSTTAPGGAFMQPAGSVPVQGMGPVPTPAGAAATSGAGIWDTLKRWNAFPQTPAGQQPGYAFGVVPMTPGPTPSADILGGIGAATTPGAVRIDPTTGLPIVGAPAATPPVPPAPPAQPQGGTGGVAAPAAGGASAAVPGSYEQALIDALADVDKRAEQDKWLAIAMAGLQTLGAETGSNGLAAIGQGYASGLGMYADSRDKAAQDKLGLQGQLEQWRQQQHAMAMAQANAGSGSGGSGMPGLLGAVSDSKLLDYYGGQLKDLTALRNDLGPVIPEDVQGNQQREALDAQIGQIRSFIGDPLASLTTPLQSGVVEMGAIPSK